MAIRDARRPIDARKPPTKRITEQIATRIYREICRLKQVLEAGRPTADDPVTLVCISDTHGMTLPELPYGDILLHAGDLSKHGTFEDIQAQLSWLASQPHPHKVVVAGNRDLLLDHRYVAAHPARQLDSSAGHRCADLDWGGIRYLEHRAMELHITEKNRSIRIFGSPWTPVFGTGVWAFQYGNGETDGAEQLDWNGAVPSDTDVLLVHGPPKGHVDDGGKGCENLLAEVWRVKPEVIVCGHVHSGRGQERLLYDHDQKWYENVMMRKRPWASVICLAISLIWMKVAVMIGLVSNHDRRSTRIVNAAVIGGRGKPDSKEAFVMEI